MSYKHILLDGKHSRGPLNNSLTVGELFEYLKKAIQNDPSIVNKAVFVSDDEEGNGYHGMYFLPCINSNEVKECCECSNTSDLAEYASEFIILG